MLATGPNGDGMVLRTGAADPELALAHRRVARDGTVRATTVM